MGASNSLGINGSLKIDFDNHTIVAGRPLKGQVTLVMNMDCPPTQLSIRVQGQERGKFLEQAHKNSRGGSGNFRHINEAVIDQTFVLCSFDQGLKKGTHIKKFSIDLPHWLPASLCVAPAYQAEFHVEYTMEAKFTAIDKTLTKQFLKNERKFWMQRPYEASNPDQVLAIDFANKVGGLLGFGKTECQAKIKFNENQLYADALVKCKLDIDNSTCSNDVEYIQMYLIQTVKTKANNIYNPYYMETNICRVVSQTKQTLIPAKKKATVELNMEIPKKLHKSYSKDKSPLYLTLTPSFNGKHLVVTYDLEVMIKHKGWNTGGEGNAVKLPVWINSNNPTVTRVAGEEFKESVRPTPQPVPQPAPQQQMQGPPQPIGNAYPVVTPEMMPQQVPNPYMQQQQQQVDNGSNGFQYPNLSAPPMPLPQQTWQMPQQQQSMEPQDMPAKKPKRDLVYGQGVDGNESEIASQESGFGQSVMMFAFSNDIVDGYSAQNDFSKFDQQPSVCQERGDMLAKVNQE